MKLCDVIGRNLVEKRDVTLVNSENKIFIYMQVCKDGNK